MGSGEMWWDMAIFWRRTQQKKTRGDIVDDISSLLGGGYLRIPASPTVVVVTLSALCRNMG